MKPKILAVKLGYNPNSSSIGIMVKIFIYHTLVISLIFAYLGFLLNFKKKKKSNEALGVADEKTLKKESDPQMKNSEISKSKDSEKLLDGADKKHQGNATKAQQKGKSAKKKPKGNASNVSAKKPNKSRKKKRNK
jgi:hypothetical protein